MKLSHLAISVAMSIAVYPGPAGAQARHAGDLVIDGAWSRPTPPGAPTAVGYLTIVNNGAAPDRLVAASSSAAATLTLHSMSTAGGVMKMRAVPEGLVIPPKSTVRLAPTGYHLMFEGLKRSLRAGDHVPATLRFEHAGKVAISFEVGDGPKSASTAPMPMGPDMHM